MREDELLPESKPVIFQDDDGNWRYKLVFVDGGELVCPDKFASEEEAALALADRIMEAGIETKKVS
jgi:hypothetical protein